MSPEDCAKILTSVAENGVQNRLDYGAALRQRMHADLKNGINPSSYRYETMASAANAVIKLLSKIAVQFNKDHESDRFSDLDLLDVLRSAIYVIEQK